MTIEEIDKEIENEVVARDSILNDTLSYSETVEQVTLLTANLQFLATLRISYIQQETDRIYLSQDLMNQ